MTDQGVRWILMFVGKCLAVECTAVAVLAIAWAVRSWLGRD